MKKTIINLFEEHQTAASILTIIIAFITINSWMTADIRSDVSNIRSDIKETNKRIDSLFNYVLTGKTLKDKS